MKFQRTFTPLAGEEIYQSDKYRFLVATRSGAPPQYFANEFSSDGFIDMLCKDSAFFLHIANREFIGLYPRGIFIDDKNASNYAYLYADALFKWEKNNPLKLPKLDMFENWVSDLGYGIEYTPREVDVSDDLFHQLINCFHLFTENRFDFQAEFFQMLMPITY